MILQKIARWIGMTLTRKTTPLIALCIVGYLYWMRNSHKDFVTLPGISSKVGLARNRNNTRDNALYADFFESWCLVKQMRRDWRRILRPCAGSMAWGDHSGYEHMSNRTDASKSYLVRWDVRPAGQFSRFDIQSVTRDNLDKRIGGDSWRVHIRGPASLSPTVIDHNNGKYQVTFLALEPGKYEVEVVLEYSQCDGYKDPPKDWFIKGQWASEIYDWKWKIFSL